MSYTMNENGQFVRDGKVLSDAFVGTIDNVAHLFVNGVSVGTLKDLGLREEQYSLKTTKEVDETTGEVTFKAIRPNGDIAITVLTSEGFLVPEKCKVIKA